MNGSEARCGQPLIRRDSRGARVGTSVLPHHFSRFQVLGQQAGHQILHPVVELLPILTLLWEHFPLVKRRSFHIKAQKCFLTVYKGDFDILTNLTMFLELFCSLIFPAVGVDRCCSLFSQGFGECCISSLFLFAETSHSAQVLH